MKWLLRLFKRTHPPERSPSDHASDPAYLVARQAYQEDKQRAMQKQIELLARLNRMGYDFDIAARRGKNYDPD